MKKFLFALLLCLLPAFFSCCKKEEVQYDLNGTWTYEDRFRECELIVDDEEFELSENLFSGEKYRYFGVVRKITQANYVLYGQKSIPEGYSGRIDILFISSDEIEFPLQEFIFRRAK